MASFKLHTRAVRQACPISSTRAVSGQQRGGRFLTETPFVSGVSLSAWWWRQRTRITLYRPGICTPTQSSSIRRTSWGAVALAIAVGLATKPRAYILKPKKNGRSFSAESSFLKTQENESTKNCSSCLANGEHGLRRHRIGPSE